VGFAMQALTAYGAATLGEALGLPVIRDGLILRLYQFVFIVAEPCSGLSSLLSLLALAMLWAYLAHSSLPARLGVLLSVLPLVALANILRVTLVLLVASWYGQEVALGFFHGASSLLLFALSLSGLMLVSRIVKCTFPSRTAA
jgi:exosortase